MAQYVIDNVQSPINFQESDKVLRTLQNAKNLLMCSMGEVPYDRLRGFDPSLYDRTIPDMEEELLPEMDRVMRWEPDAEVVDATAQRMADGSILIRVTLEVSTGEEETYG